MKLMDNDELVFNADLFGHEKGDLAPRKAVGGKSDGEVFADVKVKMIQRIYGISRAQALEMIARRAEKNRAREEAARAEEEEESEEEMDLQLDDDLGVSAAEFFGIE